jgi:hypothetical protein
MKLAQMGIVQVIANIKDEKIFFKSTSVKSKLQNELFEHLDIVICMFAQDFFTKDIFPFQVTIVIGMM